MLVLQSSLINWRQIQITMLLYSHRLELVSKAFRYEELDGFSSPLHTGPEIYQNGSRSDCEVGAFSIHCRCICATCFLCCSFIRSRLHCVGFYVHILYFYFNIFPIISLNIAGITRSLWSRGISNSHEHIKRNLSDSSTQPLNHLKDNYNNWCH